MASLNRLSMTWTIVFFVFALELFYGQQPVQDGPVFNIGQIAGIVNKVIQCYPKDACQFFSNLNRRNMR